MREWEDIFDCNGINFLVVEYGAISPILLSDIKDRGRIWGLQFLD